MTPAEKAGLAVGDRIKIMRNDDGDFHRGEIAIFKADDGTRCPYFWKEDKSEYHCLYVTGDDGDQWEKIEMTEKKSPKKQGIKPYTKRQSVQVGIKGTLADLFHELDGVVVCFDDDKDSGWHVSGSSALTVKHKGKEINPKDIKIFIEG